jgi:rusticyanin
MACLVALMTTLVWAAAAGSGFQLISLQAKTYTSSSSFPAASPELVINHKTNQLSLNTAGNVHITLLAGPKSNMMSFRVDELTNPEIRIAKGSRLTLNIVNVDDDMQHDFSITTPPPPYPAEAAAGAIVTPKLLPYKGRRYSGAVLILQAAAVGTAYYICSVPGHAHAGMYGKITILP